MKEGIFKKGLVVGIIILFIGAGIIPIISGSIGRTNSIKLKVSQSSMNCYAYGETWNKESNTVLSPDKINEIYNVFNELKHEIVYDPLSDETQALKIEFVDLLDENGLIPEAYSKDDYVSLLNPSWLNGLQNNNINNVFNELKYAMAHDPLSKNTQTLKMEFVNLLDENGMMPEGMSKIDLVLSLNPSLFGRIQNTGKAGYGKEALSTSVPSAVPYANRGTSIFCSIGSSGSGIVFPFVMLPRPRIIALWAASSAITTVANIFTSTGFIAGGAQSGISVGFMGIGLVFAFPGETIYGFVGYSLLTTVNADSIENYHPPNSPPVISNENPSNGARDIPVSLHELSFRIQDPDGDPMSYTVTTEPNIGSGNGNNKGNGVYTVPISGLQQDKLYTWTIEVTDGTNTAKREFCFFVGETPTNTIFFDDFDFFDNSKWEIFMNPIIIVSNSEITIREPTDQFHAGATLISKTFVSHGTRTIIRFKQVDTGSQGGLDSQRAGLFEYTGLEGGFTSANCVFSWDSAKQNYWRFWTSRGGSPSGWIDLGDCPDVYNYHIIYYVWDNNLAEYYYDGELKATRTVNVPEIDLNIVFGVVEGNTIVADWVAVT
jgi:hypothetical protein